MKSLKFILGIIIVVLLFNIFVLSENKQTKGQEKELVKKEEKINPTEKFKEALNWFKEVYLKQQSKLEEAINSIKDRTASKKDAAKEQEEKESIINRKELTDLNKLTWEYTNIGIPNALSKIETAFLEQEQRITELEYLLAKEKAKNSKQDRAKEIRGKKELYKKAKKEYREFLKKSKDVD